MAYTVANDGQTVTVNGNTYVIAYLDTSGTTANRLARLRKSRQATTGVNNMDTDGTIDPTADVSGSNTTYSTTDTVADASARTTTAGSYVWGANTIVDR